MSQVYDIYFSDSSYQTEDSSKYFGLSVMLHIALAVGSMFITVPLLQKVNEPITIELTEVAPLELPKPKPIVLEAPKGKLVKATRGARPISAPIASSKLDALESDIISAPVKKSKTSVHKMATLKTTTGGGTAKIAKSAPSRSGVPETLEDIAAPKLDMDGVVVEQQGALGDDEFENEFKNIDQKSDAAVRAQKSEMDNLAKMISDEQEQALAALEEQNQAEARAMQDSLQATRTKNAAALAQVKASERAAAERAAREKADREAQAKAALAGNGLSDQGRGRSESGADEVAKSANGSMNGIRSIDSLKQIPGNPKPMYSAEERLRREQGQVTYHAFVTPEGRLQNFKLKQSTGYKNLDLKTLEALKKWRFYPGQQGWVEIPQIWNLKGAAEEMPALLRRQISRK